jgi:hypothetical protein
MLDKAAASIGANSGIVMLATDGFKAASVPAYVYFAAL